MFGFGKKKPVDYDSKEIIVKLKEQLVKQEDLINFYESESKKLKVELQTLRDYYGLNKQAPLVRHWVENGIPIQYALKCYKLIEKEVNNQPQPETVTRTVVND